MVKKDKNPIKQIVIISITVSLFTTLLVGSLISGAIYSKINSKIDNFSGPSNLGSQVNVVNQERKTIEVVEKSSPSVVSIIVIKDLPVMERYYDNYDPFDNFFGDDDFFNFQVPQYRQKGTEERQIGGGTGFIVSEDGLILTNKHVVLDEEAEYIVLTNSGERVEARVVAKDPVYDLAILRIEKEGLPVLDLGDSDQIKIGQTVVAIGYALGEFSNTVSKGVVSGLKRSVTASMPSGQAEQLPEVIQTDAAINPGNSGGPLLNLSGQVIGINVAMAQGAENIAFSLPINLAKKDIQQVKEKGEISYPFLGIRYLIITKEIKEINNLSVDYGALIVRGDKTGYLAIVPGSPADKAGLQENDIILEINGIKINQDSPLNELIMDHEPGDKITLKVLHRGKEKKVVITLEEWK